MTEVNEIPQKEEEPVAKGETAGQRLPALIAAVVAVCAWVFLIVSNGYAAMGVAAMATVLGFYAAHKGWRTLATAAIIASLVLIVVTGAFLIVINYVL